jgi:hypothetical protein
VNCNVIGFVTLDEVLGFVLRRVVDIAFELNIANNFPYDDATNSTCLRIPFNVITAFESLRHGVMLVSCELYLALSQHRRRQTSR